MTGVAFADVAGGLPHGGAAAAMRGCWCGPCRGRLAELAGERPAQLELPYAAAEPLPSTGAAVVPVRRGGVLRLPAGLVPALPDGMDGIAGSRARQEVLAGSVDPADAARRLLQAGLAEQVNGAVIPAESSPAGTSPPLWAAGRGGAW
jgi:hypothetical protein